MTKTKIRCSSMNHIVCNLLRNKYQQKVRQIPINKKNFYIYKPTDKQVLLFKYSSIARFYCAFRYGDLFYWAKFL